MSMYERESRLPTFPPAGFQTNLELTHGVACDNGSYCLTGTLRRPQKHIFTISEYLPKKEEPLELVGADPDIQYDPISKQYCLLQAIDIVPRPQACLTLSNTEVGRLQEPQSVLLLWKGGPTVQDMIREEPKLVFTLSSQTAHHETSKNGKDISYDGMLWAPKGPYKYVYPNGTVEEVVHCSTSWGYKMENHELMVGRFENGQVLGSLSRLNTPERGWAIDGVPICPQLAYSPGDTKHFPPTGIDVSQAVMLWSGVSKDHPHCQQVIKAANIVDINHVENETTLFAPIWHLDGTAALYEGPNGVYNEKGKLVAVSFAFNGSWTDQYSTMLVPYKGGSLSEANSWGKPRVVARGWGHGKFLAHQDGNYSFVAHCKTVQIPGWGDRVIGEQKCEIDSDGLPFIPSDPRPISRKIPTRSFFKN